MPGLSTWILLLVACSTALVHAGPTDRDKFNILAKSLADLFSDPANDERFNDIGRYESDEMYHPKHKVVPTTTKRSKPKPLEIVTQASQTSDELMEPAKNDETPEGLMQLMFQSMFKLMGNMMRGVFSRRR